MKKRILLVFWCTSLLFSLFITNINAREASVIGTPPPPAHPTRVVPQPADIPPTHSWYNERPRLDYKIPPYAYYMQGLKICLDPGHGGYQHVKGYKSGPTGLREAVVNLRVANYLREFLLQCGVSVYMTRSGDYDLAKKLGDALRARAEVANKNQCDFFISLHHNAHSRPEANFPSCWYHEDADYLYANIDLARYICQELQDVQRHHEIKNTGLYSDYLMHPGSGFGVLRHLKVPGVIVEASFHSNPAEEVRLKDPEYNRREAYAIFLGIAKYAAAGLPTYELISPANGQMTPKDTIQLQLKDGANVPWGSKGPPRIISYSILAQLDGIKVPSNYDKKTGMLTIMPVQPLKPGTHGLTVQFMNVNKNSSLAKPIHLTVLR